MINRCVCVWLCVCVCVCVCVCSYVGGWRDTLVDVGLEKDMRQQEEEDGQQRTAELGRLSLVKGGECHCQDELTAHLY